MGLDFNVMGFFGHSNLPMVDICDEVKFSSANLSRKQVLPTPESPIKINLIK